MKIRRRILRSEEGAGAVEFALIAPALFTLIIGVAQLGTLFFANAGLKHAVSEGARLAAVYPQPTPDEIKAELTDARFGLDPDHIPAPPSVVPGESAEGWDYLDISMSYEVPLNFIFFEADPVTLTETRRVFTQDTTGSSPASGGSGGGGNEDDDDD